MKRRELFNLARYYHTETNNINRAIILYHEILKNYPGSEEAKYAQIHISTLKGIQVDDGLIIVPIPLTEEKRRYGGLEYLAIGQKLYKIKIPKNVKIGQQIRLRNVAHHVVPFLNGDIRLLVNSVPKNFYTVKRDVQFQLPIDFYQLKRYPITKRLKIGNRFFDVKIPHGLVHGQRLRIPNIAHAANGGYPGDIILKLIQKDCPKWRWWGIFDNFGQLQDSKISVKITIPWLIEISGEWVFKKENAEIYIKR
ncbi:MAG: hypothetical protein GY795_18600 [Desulfobacterales bacterium]|nr:hypothetical protein [Desulfobacterales bacterium]